MKPTRLEQDILEWILRYSMCDAVVAQLSSVSVTGRRETGAGFYTDLRPPASSDPVDVDVLSGRMIDGPLILIPGSGAIGGSILWFEDGILSCLEVHGFGEESPTSDLERYQLVAHGWNG